MLYLIKLPSPHGVYVTGSKSGFMRISFQPRCPLPCEKYVTTASHNGRAIIATGMLLTRLQAVVASIQHIQVATTFSGYEYPVSHS